ncbi:MULTISPECIES: DUF58 domain-containing protein [unclassified Mycobacterium]|uniref:DUF58 domain-containing protein n=1 Tax=unclassified Mycobacterium TaxID=2642494 RepID=UPI0029C93989|nr:MULTISPECIES: DUF58 domain-containing protein [unclassified Mycobacterium]
MTDAAESHEVEFDWGASRLAGAIATCLAVAIGLGLASSRWQLIVFAAPMLGVLWSIGRQPPTPRIHVWVRAESVGFFERERIRLSIWVETDPSSAAVQLTAAAVEGMTMHVVERDSDRVTVVCSAERWGRYPIRAHLTATARGGLLTASVTIDAVQLYVFPVAPARSTAIPRAELPDRIGTHVGRRVGSGVEYADIRAYMPGDPLRAVNWPVSARRGRLHVTDRLSEQAADVVVLIDTYPQPPGPATEATERTVRGAMQVVQTALRKGDRAGIVALGGRRPRWLAPDVGRRQFYRVLDATLGAGTGFQSSVGSLAPRPAVPPGAIVVGFSTLLNSHFAMALIDLRKRGHVVVAVDVLRDSPAAGDNDPLVDRIWSLERSFMYRNMRTIGVEVIPWREGDTLDEAMQLIPDRRASRWAPT